MFGARVPAPAGQDRTPAANLGGVCLFQNAVPLGSRCTQPFHTHA